MQIKVIVVEFKYANLFNDVVELLHESPAKVTTIKIYCREED